jgi:hypothetical protein
MIKETLMTKLTKVDNIDDIIEKLRDVQIARILEDRDMLVDMVNQYIENMSLEEIMYDAVAYGIIKEIKIKDDAVAYGIIEEIKIKDFE